MANGRHITESECKEIRRLKGKSYWVGVICTKMDVSPGGVYYHVKGKCDHPPPPDGLINTDE